MKVSITINTDNAAFDGPELEGEVARILRMAANKIIDGERSFNLKDINGNTVGKVEFKK